MSQKTVRNRTGLVLIEIYDPSCFKIVVVCQRFGYIHAHGLPEASMHRNWKTVPSVNIIYVNFQLNDDAEYITFLAIVYIDIILVVAVLSSLLWDLASKRERQIPFIFPGEEKLRIMDDTLMPHMQGIFE